MATDILRAELEIEASKALQQIKSFFRDAESTAQKSGQASGKALADGVNSGAQSIKVGDIIKANLLSSGIQQVAQSLFSGVGNFLSTQFKSATGLETTRLALNGLLGSADKAGGVLKEVVQFASTTPFEIPELADTAKLLAGYGVSADNIIPSLKALGDASAGTGTPIGQLARNFAQIQTQGKAGLIDLRQFAGAGVPIFGQLQKTLGKTKDEIENMASSGQISSTMIQKAFADMSKEGGTFFNAMKNQSNSVSGRLSTLSDTLGGLGRKILGLSDTGEILPNSIFDSASKGVQGLIDLLNSPTFDSFGNQIGSAISQAVQIISQAFSGLSSLFSSLSPNILQAGLAGLAGALLYLLIPAITAGAVAFGGFLTAMLPVLAIGALVAGVAYLIISNWQSISPIFDSVKNSIAGFAQNAQTAFQDIQKAFNGEAVNKDGVKNLLTGLGLSEETSGQIAQRTLNISASLKSAWSDISTSFGGTQTKGEGLTVLLQSLGLSGETSATISKRALDISSSLKGAFSEITQAFSGKDTGGKDLGKLLGISPEQASQVTQILSGLKQGIIDFTTNGFNKLQEVVSNPIVQSAISQIANVFTTSLLPAITSLGQTLSTVFLPLMIQIGNFLGVVLPPLITFLAVVFGTILFGAIQTIQLILSGLITVINGLAIAFTVVISVIMAVVGTIVSFLSAVFQSIYAIFTGNFGALGGIWSGFLTNLSTLWINTWNTITSALSTVWNAIVQVVTNAWNGFVQFLVNGFNSLTQNWTNFWLGIQTGLTIAWNMLVLALQIGWQTLQLLWTTGVTAIQLLWTTFWQTIQTALDTAWQNLKTAITNGIEGVKTIWTNGWNGIKSILDGIWSGIVSTVTSQVDKVKGIIDGVISTVKNAMSAISNLGSSASNTMSIGKNYTGTSYWKGGLTTVAERGRELIKLPNGTNFMANALSLLDLPRGTQIFNNSDTEKMLGGDFQMPNLALPPSYNSQASSVVNNNQNMSSSVVNNNYSNQNRFAFGSDLTFN